MVFRSLILYCTSCNDTYYLKREVLRILRNTRRYLIILFILFSLYLCSNREDYTTPPRVVIRGQSYFSAVLIIRQTKIQLYLIQCCSRITPDKFFSPLLYFSDVKSKNAVRMGVFPTSGVNLPLKLFAIPKQTRYQPRNSKKVSSTRKEISLEFHEHKVY